MDESPAQPPDLGLLPEISNTLMRGLEWAGSGRLAERRRIRLLGTIPAFLNPLSICCHFVMLPFVLLGLFQRFAHIALHLAPMLTVPYTVCSSHFPSFSWRFLIVLVGLVSTEWEKIDPFLIDHIFLWYLLKGNLASMSVYTAKIILLSCFEFVS